MRNYLSYEHVRKVSDSNSAEGSGMTIPRPQNQGSRSDSSDKESLTTHQFRDYEFYYPDIIEACRPFYVKETNGRRVLFRSELETNNPDISSVRSISYVKSKDSIKPSRSGEILNTIRVNEARKSKVNTLEEAISFTPSVRLVTESHAPYRVVHANSNFLRRAGHSTERIIGVPLDTILSSKSRSELFTAVASREGFAKQIPAYVKAKKKSRPAISLEEKGNNTSSYAWRKCEVTVIPVISESMLQVVRAFDDDCHGNPNLDSSNLSVKVSHFIFNISRRYKSIPSEFIGEQMISKETSIAKNIPQIHTVC
uniref:PAS domain-containing protein n=2 Tax=Corethron hystrix TaxID=216773 RepID=A0A7S1BWP2_9STRA|mmetsp:Transcript_42277/g.99187  ORF Transcript_42277/g.99187 Transcript_42277/m.99187 type:complete len:311 (+) Transcript_42277:178-1110(+)